MQWVFSVHVTHGYIVPLDRSCTLACESNRAYVRMYEGCVCIKELLYEWHRIHQHVVKCLSGQHMGLSREESWVRDPVGGDLQRYFFPCTFAGYVFLTIGTSPNKFYQPLSTFSRRQAPLRSHPRNVGSRLREEAGLNLDGW